MNELTPTQNADDLEEVFIIRVPRRGTLINLWSWFITGILAAVGSFVAALNGDPAMWIVIPIALIAMVRCGRGGI